jgi:hypothetical protein
MILCLPSLDTGMRSSIMTHTRPRRQSHGSFVAGKRPGVPLTSFSGEFGVLTSTMISTSTLQANNSTFNHAGGDQFIFNASFTANIPPQGQLESVRFQEIDAQVSRSQNISHRSGSTTRQSISSPLNSWDDSETWISYCKRSECRISQPKTTSRFVAPFMGCLA